MLWLPLKLLGVAGSQLQRSSFSTTLYTEGFMATKSSTPTEEALRKIQDQVTCGICLEKCKQPKLLKCFHAFCEQCLQPLERAGKFRCPKCRKTRSLPEGGVQGLEGAFISTYY